MGIKKEFRDNGNGLRVAVYTENNVNDVPQGKGKVRKEIDEQVNDIYDLVADLSKALLDVVNGNMDTANITKFKDRQAEIQALLDTYYNG